MCKEDSFKTFTDFNDRKLLDDLHLLRTKTNFHKMRKFNRLGNCLLFLKTWQGRLGVISNFFVSKLQHPNKSCENI